MPAPSGQIPPPWARWEIEAPAARAARGPSQAWEAPPSARRGHTSEKTHKMAHTSRWATLAYITLRGLCLRWGGFSVLDKRVTNVEAWRGGQPPGQSRLISREIQYATVAGADGAPRVHGPSHVPASRGEHRHDYCQPDRP
jgi:hypothetical protein